MRWAILLMAAWLAAPAEAGAYRLVTLEFPPLIFTNDRGTPAGAAVDIVTEVMRRLGHSVDVKILPWSRGIGLVQSGKADGIFTAYRNAERQAFLDYTHEPLVAQLVALYVKKGSGRTFSGDFKDLKGAVIGTINTISYGSRFDQAKETLKLKTERVESLEENFRKLAVGRLDYVVSNRYSGEVAIETLKLMGQVVELPHAVEVTPSYLAFSKKRGLVALRDAFDKELLALKRSGRYQEILARYRVRAPVTE